MTDALRIQGVLLRDATKIFDRKADQYKVRVLVGQKGCAWPYMAEVSYGSGQAASIAANSACHHMRAGMDIVVHGRSDLKPRRNVKELDGVNCLELQHASFIEHPTDPVSATLAEQA